MTREEAIEVLTSKDVSMMLEALDMAINALEQLTSYEQTINKLTKAISEQEPTTHGYMLVCPNCGLDVHSDFESCPRCGENLKARKYEERLQRERY